MQADHSTSAKLVEFFRVSPQIILPMRADKSALGGIPAAAHQYCEALRTASSFGWYVFPPADISLRWDGAEVFLLNEREGEGESDGAPDGAPDGAGHGRWEPLTSHVSPGMGAAWDAACPPHLKGGVPPYVSALFVPGVVQIWSGLFAATAADWNVLVRPLANVVGSRAFSVYEGVIETGWFKPCPVFINIRLLATNEVIHIARNKPLFQLQPLHAICFQDAIADAGMFDALPAIAPQPADAGGTAATSATAFWDGVSNTIRSVSAERPPDFGRYGAEARRRAKRVGADACPHLRAIQ